MSAIRGCLSIEVDGRAVGTFRIVRYIVGVRYSGVSVRGGSTVLVKLQALAAVGIRAEMQFLACCVSLGKYFRATHAHTELRTLHFVHCISLYL